jgi:hypothetical protein
MALTHRFPVLLWQDHQGGWSAGLLDRDEPAGFGRNASLALDRLEDHLAWRFAQNPWLEGPDFHDPELIHVKVPVLVRQGASRRPTASPPSSSPACSGRWSRWWSLRWRGICSNAPRRATPSCIWTWTRRVGW